MKEKIMRIDGFFPFHFLRCDRTYETTEAARLYERIARSEIGAATAMSTKLGPMMKRNKKLHLFSHFLIKISDEGISIRGSDMHSLNP
jgi:hypothetical protein